METIEVLIALHGELRARHPERRQEDKMVLPRGATVEDALRVLGNEGDAWVVSVNAMAVQRDHEISDGDRMDLYPFIEGG